MRVWALLSLVVYDDVWHDLCKVSNSDLLDRCKSAMARSRLGCQLFRLHVFWTWGGEARLDAVVSLDKVFYNALGKVFAVLFQLWLMFGPCLSTLSRACRRVRAICTDFGTERLIARSPNVLAKFGRLLGVKWDTADAHGPFLFPRCLQIPGWRHIVDNLIRHGLCACRWFAGFIKPLKLLVAFLRNYGNKVVWVRHPVRR